MTIVENLRLQIHSCKVACQDQKLVDLRNYLEKLVLPRLNSYAIFLKLIDSLPKEHSLRSDTVTIDILEDYRQLDELADKAGELL